MRMSRMLVATAMVLASGFAAQPASAEDRILDPALVFIPPGQTTCQSGYLCLFRDAFMHGGGWALERGRELNDLDGGVLDFAGQMSSWINATNRQYCWAPGTNFDGVAHFMDPNSSVSVMPPGENDTASSIQTC